MRNCSSREEYLRFEDSDSRRYSKIRDGMEIALIQESLFKALLGSKQIEKSSKALTYRENIIRDALRYATFRSWICCKLRRGWK